jgi:hypothetical protein
MRPGDQHSHTISKRIDGYPGLVRCRDVLAARDHRCLDERQRRAKAEMGYPGRVKRRRVSFMDSQGIEHAVELDSRTLYEAVGLAIERFHRCEHVSYDPKGLHEFIVESREPSTQYRLTRRVFDAWLCRPGGSPADVSLRGRLKGLLGNVV